MREDAGTERAHRKMIDLLITNAAQVVTVRALEGKPLSGHAMSDVGIIPNGAVAVDKGEILAIGATEEILARFESPHVIDASGKVVTPGLVDPHTHLVFAGSRENEFEMRLRGASYKEIASAGGGILSTVRIVRRTSREQLLTVAGRHLDRMFRYGTTTVEAKSGYGLSTTDEIKILQVIQQLDREHPADIVATFMGAHDVPDEYRNRKADYIRLIKEEMIPEVRDLKLAEFCDVFCEKGVFEVEEAREILTCAGSSGMRLKIHADELSDCGGAKLAAEMRAVSADHLIMVSEEGIEAMAAADVIPVLLPTTSFMLGFKNHAPARKMIQRNLPVALATDFNPGTSMTESMQMVMTFACVLLKMSPAEALAAATINAAYAIGRGNAVGSLQTGKQADILIWNVPSLNYIPYHFGVNLVETVIKNGVVCCENRP